MSKQAGRMSQSANDFLAPLAPTIGTATNVPSNRPYNDGRADVSFTANASGAAATSYTVTASPGGYTATGSSSPISVTGLQSATAYTFTVTGTNAVGTGPASAASNSITATTVPQTPSGLSATDTGTGRPFNNAEAIISLSAPATGGTDITSYGIQSNDGGYATSGTSLPLSAAGIASGATYSFRVNATNANGTSGYSDLSNAVTLTTVPQTPSAPSASSPSAGTDSVSWSAPNNGGKAITNYRWTSDDGKSGDTSGTSVSVGQEQGSAQTYNVYATNANGNSGTSAQSGSVTTVFSAFGAFGAFGAFSAFGAFGAFGAFSAFGAFGAFGAFSAFGAFGAFGAYYKSISLHTLVLTPNGYTQASNLKVGDELVSAEIPGLGMNFTLQDVQNWTGDPATLQIVPDKVTTIVGMGSSQATHSVSVNGEFYSGNHTMLVNRDGIARMVTSIDLLETDQLWSADTNTWTPLTELIISEIAHEVISINCEPYDLFYTDHFLVYDGYQIENQ